jgi:endonuclease/exonuclease/phosphatase family metal-dependent hydrolase
MGTEVGWMLSTNEESAQAARGESNDVVQLRVATWNMDHWRRTQDQRRAGWDHVLAGMGVDVVLLQETVPPREQARDRVVYQEIGDFRAWGSAVAAASDRVRLEEISTARTPFSRRRFTLRNTYPGSVSIARAEIEGVAPITFVSVYTVIDVYAQTTLLRQIADLIPLFDSADGARVILAGDLNLFPGIAGANRGRIEGIFGALRSVGLVDISDLDLLERPVHLDGCPCGLGEACRHFPTWGKYQLDHMFVSEALSSQVRGLRLDTDAVSAGMSDHTPVIADFALDRGPVARAWDAEAFEVEIGRRWGPAAMNAVESLVAWAKDTETALRTAGRRDIGLTRFPTTVSADPQMWWQLDYRPDRPAATQSLISIRATGEVVVPVQYMTQPPFDDIARRDAVRVALNEIPQVAIPAGRLTGRPSFPLAVIQDAKGLAILLSVLDRIVDETDFSRVSTPGAEVAVTPPEG